MQSSIRRGVASNTAVQVAGKGAILALGAASLAILTRYPGPDDYGRFTLALMYMQLFGVLADVGLFTTVVREISKRPERTEELAGNALTLRLLLSIAVICLASAISLLLPYPPDVRVAIVLAGGPLLFGRCKLRTYAGQRARGLPRSCVRPAGPARAVHTAQIHIPPSLSCLSRSYQG